MRGAGDACDKAMPTPRKQPQDKRPGGRPTLYKVEHCEAVIAMGSQGKTLAEMAAGLGVDRATLADWIEKYPEFSRAIKAGLDRAQAWWEEQGRLATFGAMPGFNATSYIFQMKNRFKADWRDKQELDHTSSDGTMTPTRIEIVAATADDNSAG
jgi:hypothetical protein